MSTRLTLEILPQPDETTCGPTCLHAVYRYYGDRVGLDRVVKESGRLKWGGTLAVMLACHALRRGYRATIYTYNLDVFDPTWFEGAGDRVDLAAKLRARRRAKKGKRLKAEIQAYQEFLELGGLIRYEDLRAEVVAEHLRAGRPILTGLSATYLYRTAREYGRRNRDDDIRGDPSGHFVVLSGYDPATGLVTVADPLEPNPPFDTHYYEVGMERLVCSILLGVLTYDANLLVLEPGASAE